MTALIVFLLTLAATVRLTRLAIHDGITQPFRDSLATRASREPRRKRASGKSLAATLVKLFSCPWCVGFWLSAMTAAVELHVANPVPSITMWFTYPALVLTLSQLVGIMDMATLTLELYEPPGSPNRY